MPEELTPLDVSDVPAVRQLVEDVLEAGQPRVLQIDSRGVAVLTPTASRTRGRRSRATSADDPLWNIVGIAESGGPGTVSEDVDAYLVEAYSSNRE